MPRPRSSTTTAVRGLTALAALALLAAALPGCYTRVVDARGIGGDSEKLRHEHERQSPLRALTTTTEREKKPSSGVW